MPLLLSVLFSFFFSRPWTTTSHEHYYFHLIFLCMLPYNWGGNKTGFHFAFLLKLIKQVVGFVICFMKYCPFACQNKFHLSNHTDNFINPLHSFLSLELHKIFVAVLLLSAATKIFAFFLQNIFFLGGVCVLWGLRGWI